MQIATRRRLILFLTSLFFVQTWMVYSDPAGRAAGPLSEQAAAGRELWHQHNCQSCHQLYGFGGFLGPDLTNFAGRVDSLDTRLATILTTGSERMPAFHLGDAQRQAVAAFLTAMDKTGVGQVVLTEAQPPRALFEQQLTRLAEVEAPSALELEGQAVALRSGCIDCHLPNSRSTFRATDLSRLHDTVDPARVQLVLSEGLPEKGMPPLGLNDQEKEALTAFLGYLDRQGDQLRAGFAGAERSSEASLLGLPWFEYP